MHGDRTNEHFDIQNLKQVLYSERNFRRQVKLIELVIPTTVTLPQEGLLMWDSHYLMGNFMLISWTDQTILSGYASLDKLWDFSPHRCTCFSSFGIHRHVTFLIYSHTFLLGIFSVTMGILSLCVNKTHHSLTDFSEGARRNLSCNERDVQKLKEEKITFFTLFLAH